MPYQEPYTVDCLIRMYRDVHPDHTWVLTGKHRFSFLAFQFSSVSNKDSMHFDGIRGMQMILWLWLWIGMLWDYSVCLRLWQQTWAGPALSCQHTHSGETLNCLEPCCDAALIFSILVAGNSDCWFNKVTLSRKNAKTYLDLIPNNENKKIRLSPLIRWLFFLWFCSEILFILHP